MPRLTIYGKFGKRNTVKAIDTLNDYPLDYPDLKEILLTTAQKIYMDHDQQTETEISLWQHQPGKYKRAFTSYRTSRIRTGKRLLFKCRLTYNPQTDTIKIDHAAFIDNFGTTSKFMYLESYREEKGKKHWRPPPKLVPDGFREMLNNPKMMFTQLLTVKTSNYQGVPRKLYEPSQQQRHTTNMYAGQTKGAYGAMNWISVEQDEQEKENRL